MHCLSWSLSLRIQLASFSRCNCGILSLCIKRELNLIEYRGSEKYRNYSCLYMSVVAVASPLSLVDGFFFAGQNDVPLSSLCCGVCCSTFLSSFLLLPLNFNSAFCCCSRGTSSPRQEFASTFWMQSCFCFSGSVALNNKIKQKIMKTDFHFHISRKMYALLVCTTSPTLRALKVMLHETIRNDDS